MALSQIIGLALVVVGVAMYVISIWGYVQKRRQRQQESLGRSRQRSTR